MKKIQNLFLIKTAKILNMLLIGITTIILIFSYGIETTMKNSFKLFIFLIIRILIAGILMIFSIIYLTIMMIKGFSGALTTLISSILVFISPIVTQLMLLGILVFILSVISIIKLRKYERIVLFKK